MTVEIDTHAIYAAPARRSTRGAGLLLAWTAFVLAMLAIIGVALWIL